MNLSFLLSLITLVPVADVLCLRECGQVKSEGNSPFPWNVGIYVENQNQLELICFGSVIQSNAILTAAHCFCDSLGGTLRNATFYIASGQLSKTFNPKSLPSTLQKINKNSIHIQKYYKGITTAFANDLAIIKDNFSFSNVKPVCIDWSADIKENNFGTKQPIWYKNQVIAVDQTYLKSPECSSAPQNLTPFITDDKFCTKIKTSGVRLSHESEGAGLVFSHSDRWYLKGVINMHDVTNGEFSTYTSANQFLNWISNVAAG